MRYINLRFTYLLTYLLTLSPIRGNVACKSVSMVCYVMLNLISIVSPLQSEKPLTEGTTEPVYNINRQSNQLRMLPTQKAIYSVS